MWKSLLLVLGLVGLVGSVAMGQGTPIATTDTTRGLLRATNVNDFRLRLGFNTTNYTAVTNYVGDGANVTNLNASELKSGTVPLARLSGITASQVADATLTTNKIDSTFYSTITAPPVNITGNAATATTATTAITATNLAGGTASASSLVVSNADFSKYSVNLNGTDAGADTYGGRMYYRPSTSGAYSWLKKSGAQFTDVWGAANYVAMQFLGSDFDGLLLNTYDFANSGNHLNRAGVAVSAVALAYGGSAAAMNGLPKHPKARQEALPYPPTFITSWNNVDLVLGQADVEAQLRNATTNGLLYAFTNQGLPLWYHIDENVNFITNNRVNITASDAGDLAIDTAAIPSGTNFLWRWQTNGWKFALTHYPWRIPTNAYNRLESVGQVLPGTANSSPVATPITIARDITKFYEWGIDMFRGSDMQYDNGYQFYWANTIADLISNPQPPSNPYSSFWKEAYGQGRSLRPMAFHWMTPRIGGTDPSVMMQANVINHDEADVGYGPFVGYFSPPNNTIGIMNRFRAIQTNEVPYASPGCFPSGPTLFDDADTITEARLILTMVSMQWGLLNICTRTNSELSAFMPIMCQQMTNANWVASRKDLTDISTMMFDNGYTNTSGWKRRAADNSYYVFLSNESNNTASVTYTWNQLGVPDTQTYLVQDLWNGTNMGFFNRSHSLSIAATNHYWLRLTPVVQETVSLEQASLVNFLRIESSSESPADLHLFNGIKGLSSSVRQFTIPLASWATNVTIESYVQCSGISTWTNLIEPLYYRPGAGRAYNTAGVNNSNEVFTIGVANTFSNWTTMITFPATNVPKAVRISFQVASNSPAVTHYIGPNLKITYQ